MAPSEVAAGEARASASARAVHQTAGQATPKRRRRAAAIASACGSDQAGGAAAQRARALSRKACAASLRMFRWLPCTVEAGVSALVECPGRTKRGVCGAAWLGASALAAAIRRDARSNIAHLRDV